MRYKEGDCLTLNIIIELADDIDDEFEHEDDEDCYEYNIHSKTLYDIEGGFTDETVIAHNITEEQLDQLFNKVVQHKIKSNEIKKLEADVKKIQDRLNKLIETN